MILELSGIYHPNEADAEQLLRKTFSKMESVKIRKFYLSLTENKKLLAKRIDSLKTLLESELTSYPDLSSLKSPNPHTGRISGEMANLDRHDKFDR